MNRKIFLHDSIRHVYFSQFINIFPLQKEKIKIHIKNINKHKYFINFEIKLFLKVYYDFLILL